MLDLREPTISICVPARLEREENLERLITSLKQQTCKDFELVLCYDDQTGYGLVSTLEHGFVTWYTSINRNPMSKHLAHRNHARNHAAKHARGRWLFFCDTDMVLDPHWVAHAVTAAEHGVWAFSSPIVYLDQRGRPRDHAFGTMNAYYRRSDKALFVKADYANPEGMPCIRRELFEALGKFNEQFLGWGSNKVEFIARLNASAADYHVLASAQCWHNWHEPEDGPDKDPALVARNAKLLDIIRQDIKNDAGWWHRTNCKVKELLNEHC